METTYKVLARMIYYVQLSRENIDEGVIMYRKRPRLRCVCANEHHDYQTSRLMYIGGMSYV